MALEAVLGIECAEDIGVEYAGDTVALNAAPVVECGEYGSVLHILKIREAEGSRLCCLSRGWFELCSAL